MTDQTHCRDVFADFCAVGKANLTKDQRDALSYLYLAAKNTRAQASAPEGGVVGTPLCYIAATTLDSFKQISDAGSVGFTAFKSPEREFSIPLFTRNNDKSAEDLALIADEMAVISCWETIQLSSAQIERWERIIRDYTLSNAKPWNVNREDCASSRETTEDMREEATRSNAKAGGVVIDFAKAVITACEDDLIANTSHADTVGVLEDAAREILSTQRGDGSEMGETS
jgi:hypothetical protein